MKHRTGTVERILGRDFGRAPMGFQITEKDNGLNINSKTNTIKLLRA
jgi:hypothetical protein